MKCHPRPPPPSGRLPVWMMYPERGGGAGARGRILNQGIPACRFRVRESDARAGVLIARIASAVGWQLQLRVLSRITSDCPECGQAIRRVELAPFAIRWWMRAGVGWAGTESGRRWLWRGRWMMALSDLTWGISGTSRGLPAPRGVGGLGPLRNSAWRRGHAPEYQ